MNFTCGCCGDVFPPTFKNTHHIIPRATGGKDTPDNLIDLCPGCHDALHALAYKMVSKNASTTAAIDQTRVIFKDNEKGLRKCIELAQHAADAMVVTREKGVAHDQVVPIATTLTKGTKDLAMARARSLGTSQEGYLRSLILQDLGDAFPQVRGRLGDEVMAIRNAKAKKKAW